MPKQQPGTSDKKRTKLLLGVLVFVIVIGAIVMWLFSRTPSGPPQDGATDIAASAGTAVPELNFSVLESETFSRFKVWSVIPLRPGATGKSNPFGQ